MAGRAGPIVFLLLVALLLLGAVAAYLNNPDILYDLAGQRAPACKNPEGDDAAKEDLGDSWRMTYRWHFSQEDWRLSLEIPKDAYQEFHDEDRDDHKRVVRFPDGYYEQPAYDEYVTDSRDDVAIRTIAQELQSIAAQEGWSEAKALSFTLAFVQCLPYTSDEVTSNFDEYPRFPLETLVDAGGDCEDTSILYASLVLAMGHDAVLLSPPAHMAVGVAAAEDAPGVGYEYNEQRYLYAETTGDGYGIGDIPGEYSTGQVQVFPLDG